MINYDTLIIPYYSPISAKGGSKAHGKRSRKVRTRKHKKSNKSRTRRRYR